MVDNRQQDPQRFFSPLQTQNIAAGAKATNVIMQSQQAEILEYDTEPAIPQVLQDREPNLTMLVMKRSIGNEAPLDIIINNIQFNMIRLLQDMCGKDSDVVIGESFDLLHSEEGLRAKNMTLRLAQATSRTIEDIRSSNLGERRGVLDKITSFVTGKKHEPQNPILPSQT